MANKDGSGGEALRELLPEEELRWHGAPQPFRLLTRDAGRSILSKWIGSAAAVALGGWFCARSGKAWSELWLLALIAAAVAVSPLLEARKLRRCRYWLTSRRALLALPDGSVAALRLEEIGAYRIIRSPHGDALVLGSASFVETEGQLRWRACHPKEPPDERFGMVFYALDCADTVAQYLSGTEKK